ncbi:MAG: phosphoribosylformylglycinamidine synthase subunit PurQ [Fimbriimonadaceae bacterium]|jgi:phosphoribosylformylglycinamidine synthase|nr:phosphoribosylformylglycinamidine synthase subunit PurQ [Fimbriimonadaceae bacterium]
MKVAVIRFPGSNCDQDAFHSLNDDLGVSAEYVWHQDNSLSGYEGVFLPGGFSYGDYLRCGAMAAQSTIMQEVRRFASEGKLVIGACNGFQVLCETHLLPGALLLNEQQKFICQDVYLRRESSHGPFLANVPDVISLPIAHGEGRYIADDETLKRLNGEGLVAFRYCDGAGNLTSDSNINGSVESIAGILSQNGNVLGLMPHPERATKALLGGVDGRTILGAFQLALSKV